CRPDRRRCRCGTPGCRTGCGIRRSGRIRLGRPTRGDRRRHRHDPVGRRNRLRCGPMIAITPNLARVAAVLAALLLAGPAQADYAQAFEAYVAKDYGKAFELATASAKDGDFRAEAMLGALYFEGD